MSVAAGRPVVVCSGAFPLGATGEVFFVDAELGPVGVGDHYEVADLTSFPSGPAPRVGRRPG
jgi:hypothetical protein